MFKIFSSHQIDTPVNIQVNYSSKLTVDSPMYYRDCKIPKCYYETFQVNVIKLGSYVLWSESSISTYGYIYKDNFDPLKPSENLLSEHNGTCNQEQFKLIIDLKNDTQYVLVVTTYRSYTVGSFSILISGPDNVILSHFSKYLRCFRNIKDKCIEYERCSST
jgi:hypothetical protein